MLLKTDCRHFPGSRPCRFNKEFGQACPRCPHYLIKGKRILITKLDALGDVLRTTALLPGLKEKYPDSYVVWVTKASVTELFGHNPFVDELWAVETDALPRLLTEEFDLVINTDADKRTAALASVAKTHSRLGMMLNRQGDVVAATPEATEWLEMGAFDQLKKANRKTYQQIIYEMCGLDYRQQRPVLLLTKDEYAWGAELLHSQGRDAQRKLIGLNLGGGGRWKNKRWTEDHILAFSEMVARRPDLQLLLIGGPWERELIARLEVRLANRVFFSGTDRTLRELASLVAACDTLVTGDSLALHIATALGIRVVALFGPTSAAEIELYGNGVSIVPAMGCCCCYLPTCTRRPNCMTSITPDVVLEHVLGPQR